MSEMRSFTDEEFKAHLDAGGALRDCEGDVWEKIDGEYGWTASRGERHDAEWLEYAWDYSVEREPLKTEAQPDPLPLSPSTAEVAQLLGVKPALQGDAVARKNAPMFRGVVTYFPDALASVAELSRIGNEQHNKGQPMHWAYGKSSDHGDCIIRHQADYDEVDTDGVLHATKVAWRALAQLQTVLEKSDAELHALRQAQRDRQARGER